ncbi:MAG: LemA family protein [Neisseriaceae bacterium]|nr:LemA family protein [Neisseriaceae bacterium]
MSVISVILLVLVALAVVVIVIFNRMVLLKNRFQNAFAQIEVQLIRRHDLIPNLVETAKAYLKHEHETMQEVIEARNGAAKGLAGLKNSLTDPTLVQTFAAAEQGLQSALGRFNMVVENYPELKADKHMIMVHEELTSTENRIGFARQFYNDMVTEYNVFRQYFPCNIIAYLFRHRKDAVLLEFDDKAAIIVAPEVKFSE